MKMMQKTWDRFNKMMNNFSKEMDETFEEMNKEMEEALKDTPSADLPEGVSEVITEETETKPDGTVIRRKVTRRTSTTK